VAKALEAAVPGSVVVGSSTWPHIADMFEAKPADGGHMTIIRSLLPDDSRLQEKPSDAGLLPIDVLLQASSTLEQYCHEGARCCAKLSCYSAESGSVVVHAGRLRLMFCGNMFLLTFLFWQRHA